MTPARLHRAADACRSTHLSLQILDLHHLNRSTRGPEVQLPPAPICAASSCSYSLIFSSGIAALFHSHRKGRVLGLGQGPV